MANRSFDQHIETLQKGLALLCGQFDVGGTGAVTSGTVKGNGIASVARSGTGKYLITLDDAYYDLRNFSWSCDELAVGAAGVDDCAAVAADDVTNGVPNKKLTVQFRNAGTATDPASGVRIKFNIWLRNSGIRIAGE